MFLFPMLLAVVVSAPADSTVVLPLAEYERLRHQESPEGEVNSATVVEEIQVRGSLRKDTLEVTFSGRSVGKPTSVPVLIPSDAGSEPRLGRCEGQALLQRSPDGRFLLLPLAAQFHLKCHLSGDGHFVQLSVPSAVLEVRADVKDAEVRSVATDGGRTLFLGATLTPAVAAAVQVDPPSVLQGRYQLSVTASETRFRYRLKVRNNAGRMAVLEVRLAGSERVERTEPESNRASGGALRLQVPPGESSVTLDGKLMTPRFVAPLPLATQYLLLESDPLLRLEVTTRARRISASETGMTATAPGAWGFLLTDAAEVTWKATPLQAFAATRYTVSQAQHTFFLGDDGKALAESRIQLDNRGLSALSLPMSGQPIFASLQGEPRALTHDDAGDLWIPLNVGPQELVVQQKEELWHDWALASGALELPRLEAPATEGSVELRYGQGWVPLYESFGGDRRTALPGAKDVAGFLSWLVWTERLCCGFAMRRGRRWLLAVFASLSAVVSGPAHFALLSFDSVVTALWLVPVLRRFPLPALSRGLTRLRLRWVVLALALGVMGVVTLSGDSLYRLFGNAADSLGGNTNMADSYQVAGDKAGTGLASDAQSTYAGIAVRTELPLTQRRTVFSRQLLDTAAPVAARIVLLSSMAVLGLQGLLLALALLITLLSRAQLLQGIRGALNRAIAMPVPGGQQAVTP